MDTSSPLPTPSPFTPSEPRTTTAQIELCEPDMARILSGFAVREQILGMLLNVPIHDALGACLSYMQHVAEKEPGQLRAALDARVTLASGQRVRLADFIARAAR